MRDLADVLEGAVDLHRHGYPEISDSLRTPISDIEDITLCRDAGMSAVVLKSHVWPTIGRAQLLQQAVPGITVISSITLNRFSGGMNPDVVEMAGRQGAGVVFLPTASAASDISRGGISRRIADEIQRYEPANEAGVTVTDADGKLTRLAEDCLDVLDEWPMLVYSGHLSVPETLAILRSGRVSDRFVFAHPDSHSIGADDAAIVAAVDLGAYIEICALGTYPQIGRVSHSDLANMIRLVGAERCVATSDYFFSWCPPSSQMLTSLAEGLAAEGITTSELQLIMRDNPRKLVALTP